jgi:ATP-dependent RNA helicase DHX37/DHR1
VIVVATNVAETSLTIPGMRYVIDSGRSKEKEFDEKLQFSKFAIKWISRASAEQRAGRAGRTGPGHCYRLYSSALFTKLDEFSPPEITKAPLDQTILQLKAIGVEDIFKFPYVTRPPLPSIRQALRHLAILGAVDFKNPDDIENYIT